MPNFLSKLLSVGSGKEIKAFRGRVGEINYLEDEISQVSDEELRGKTAEFRRRISNGETLDELMPEAFAVVREASDAHASACVISTCSSSAAWCFNDGQIAEMKTGEGKTLVSTLAGYLNALPGRGRAHRHRQRLPRPAATASGWARSTASSAWRSASSKTARQTPSARSPPTRPMSPTAPTAEFGFDYLRDNMVTTRRLARAARARLRHRRRGRLHPHRRGAHAAHHLGRRHAGRRTPTRKFAPGMSGHLARRRRLRAWTRRKRTISATESGLGDASRRCSGIDDIYADPSGPACATTCSRR